MKKLLVSGYVSLDRIIKTKTTLKINQTAIVTNKHSNQIQYGGCSINIACLLSKLQLKTTPLIRVGYDFSSSGLKGYLNKHDVDLTGVTKIKGEQTSLAYLIETNKKEHYTLFYPGAMDANLYVNYDETIFSISDMLIMTINSYKDNFELLRLAKRFKLSLVLGMKLDDSGYPEVLLADILDYARLIFANEHEAKQICRQYHLKKITDLFKSSLLHAIIITKGKDGAIIYSRDEVIKIKAVAVKKIVDTTGAGDAFLAGFIYGYRQHLSLEICAKYGAVLASFIIEKYGCTTNAPTVVNFIRRYKKVGKLL